MFAIQPTCQETVSLLTALFLGADGACVDLNGRSLIFALVSFVLAVFLLQKLANRVLFGRSRARKEAEATPRLRAGQVSTHIRTELR
jgi:hypothetical protein